MTSFFWMEIHRFIQPTALLNQKSLMLQHVLSNHFRRRKTQLTPIKPDAHSARPQREAHKKPRAAWLHFRLPSPEGQTREAAAERPAGARVQCPALRGRRWAARPGEARHGTYPGVPERHRRARREHRQSRHPRAALGRQCRPPAPLCPAGARQRVIPLRPAGLGCGELRSAGSAGRAAPLRSDGSGEVLAVRCGERARAGSRGRACAALPSSRSPSFPPCPVAARARPARRQGHLAPSRAGDSDGGPFPLTSSEARREPAPAEEGRTVAGWKDGAGEGGTAAGSRGSRARAGANCAKRRPLLQRVHARARSRWRRRGRAWPGTPRDLAAAPGGGGGKEARGARARGGGAAPAGAAPAARSASRSLPAGSRPGPRERGSAAEPSREQLFIAMVRAGAQGLPPRDSAAERRAALAVFATSSVPRCILLLKVTGPPTGGGKFFFSYTYTNPYTYRHT